MKKQRKLKTRILTAFVLLVTAVLAAVMIAFNLYIESYIRSRVTAQLSDVSESMTDERAGHQHGRAFDERPDRTTGAKGNAFLMSSEGGLLSVLHGENDPAAEIAERFASGKLNFGALYTSVKAESGTYAVSSVADPVQENVYIVSFIDVTALNALTARVNIVLIIIIAAAIVVSVALSRIIARSFAKPVQDLRAFAADIGAGDLNERSMSFRTEELSGLADSMNLMARELRESKQKQETFFQNVSHELRTPLTSIRGSAEGIVCGVMEPKEAGRVILSESDRLTGMVEDILYLSRMDRVKPETPNEPIDLREVLSLCVSQNRMEAEAKSAAFDFDFDGEPVDFPIREQDAERLFGNLVSNAVRHANSRVTLVCRTEGEKRLVSVKDDGPGVSEKDLPHIFERFYKGEGGRHGIGLSIAKSVADAYGGQLTVRNEGGAVFEVIL